ncbi:S-layer homology domain-containing protein [Paenibacillus sabuli]|uniref:S-layer homology domain-containing protein n=1 Tax=Paenibacillus sabuli TaxID=2772509 RepID=UPI001684E73E|nr:S-layer homology domain-containing protein [Paenibacillus sabuli]
MKRYIALWLALLLVAVPALAGTATAAAVADGLALELGASVAKRGERMAVSGSAPAAAARVTVQIVRPDQSLLYVDVLDVTDGRYDVSVRIPEDAVLAPLGAYTVTAGAQGVTASATFEVVGESGEPGRPDEPGDPGGPEEPGGPGEPDEPGAPGGPDEPGDPDPDDGGSGGDGANEDSQSGDVDDAADDGRIPPQAGEASGGVIAPEMEASGRLVVGIARIRAALEAAEGRVVIELPDEALADGGWLELPVEALYELEAQDAALVLGGGGMRLDFPAGAIGSAETARESGRLRIRLQLGWGETAAQAAAQAMGGDTAYSAADLALRVELTVLDGDEETDAGALAEPAHVRLTLDAGRLAQLDPAVAGVYLVDDGELLYAGGRLDDDGTLTFAAPHFSTYAVLHYDRRFADLRGHWAEEQVRRLAARHIVTGVGAARYEPQRAITRAEFATLVMRGLDYAGLSAEEVAAQGAAGANAAQGAASAAVRFDDVQAGSYYEAHVHAAAALGLVRGYDGRFRPGDAITRQEAAALLARAADLLGLGASMSGSMSGSVSGSPAFADREEIAEWASADVKRAWSLGLIEGYGGAFHPLASATRAEVATMIGRLVTEVN